MQATKFLAPQNIAPTLKIGNLGQPRYLPLIQHGNGVSQMNANLPAGNPQNGTPSQAPGKIVTLPAPTNTTTNNNGIGKITTLPVTIGKGGSPVDVKTTDVKSTNIQTQNNPIRINNGVKLNNNPVNKVQVQNSWPQFKAMGNGGGNNVRQSMNRSNMNGGNNRRGFMH